MGKDSPFFSANAWFENGPVTAMPTSWAFRSISRAIESRKVHISFVQTDVKAPTKNARRVLFLRNSVRLRGFKSVSGKVKSGALSPTFIVFGNRKTSSKRGLTVYKSVAFLSRNTKHMDKC